MTNRSIANTFSRSRGSMSEKIVKDLMVPLEHYATVTEDATLYDTIVELEKSQEAHCKPHRRHLSVLVVDSGGEVVGKVSLWDALRALDVVESIAQDGDDLSRFGFNPELVRSMMVSHRVWSWVRQCNRTTSLR